MADHAIFKNEVSALPYTTIKKVPDAEISEALGLQVKTPRTEMITRLFQIKENWKAIHGDENTKRGDLSGVDIYWQDYYNYIDALMMIVIRYGVILETHEFNPYQQQLLQDSQLQRESLTHPVALDEAEERTDSWDHT